MRCTKSYGVSSTWPATMSCVAEHRAHPLEQQRLADRGDRLQRADVGRAASSARARACPAAIAPEHHEHDLVAVGARGRELAAQLHAARRRRARPTLDVIDDVPTFTTAIATPRSRRAPRTYSSSIGRRCARRRRRARRRAPAPARRPCVRSRCCTYAIASGLVRSASATDALGGPAAARATRRRRRARPRSPAPRAAARRTARARPRRRAPRRRASPSRPRNSSSPARVTAEIARARRTSTSGAATSALVPTTRRGRSSSSGR